MVLKWIFTAVVFVLSIYLYCLIIIHTNMKTSKHTRHVFRKCMSAPGLLAKLLPSAAAAN